MINKYIAASMLIIMCSAAVGKGIQENNPYRLEMETSVSQGYGEYDHPSGITADGYDIAYNQYHPQGSKVKSLVCVREEDDILFVYDSGMFR